MPNHIETLRDLLLVERDLPNLAPLSDQTMEVLLDHMRSLRQRVRDPALSTEERERIFEEGEAISIALDDLMTERLTKLISAAQYPPRTFNEKTLLQCEKVTYQKVVAAIEEYRFVMGVSG